MIFEHTYLERWQWRGWFRNGQSLEVNWSGGSVGLRLVFHSCDRGCAERFFWIGLGLIGFYIPLGYSKHDWPVGDEPSWGFDLSREFGIVWHWNLLYKSWRWPFHRILLDHLYRTESGWKSEGELRRNPPDDDEFAYLHKPDAKRETHPYTYVLASGEMQKRKATIFEERWVRGRHLLSRIGWPSRIEHSIYIDFDGEVGERTGSWKGGTVGCSYTMRSGESALDTLRRMERERKFN